MAQLTGTSQTFHDDTSIVDSSQSAELGRRAWDTSGNEYIYLSGTASTVSGDWVKYNNGYKTERLAADMVGPVAIAMAAVTADKFGWYQVYGINTVARTDTVSSGASLYIDGTTGRADDLGVVGDLIIGALSMTADASNVATVSLNYPHVTNDLGQSGTAVPGGSSGAVQYNSSSSFAGSAGFVFNQVTGSATLTGLIEVESVRIEDSNASNYLNLRTTSNLTADQNFTLVPGNASRTLTMSGDINVAADLITSGSNSLTFTTTGATNVTLPTTGTLATLAGTETLTNKTLTSPTATNATLNNTTTLATSLNTVLAANSGVVGTATSTQVRVLLGSASTTSESVVELATAAEITTGTDASRVITPDTFAGSDYGKRLVQLKVVADDTAATTGSDKAIFFVPVELNGMNLVDVEAYVTSTASTVQTIHVRKIDGTATNVSMLSTNITIDATEWSSLTAATVPVIDTSNDDVATGNMIAIDFGGNSGTVKGVGVQLSFQTP